MTSASRVCFVTGTRADFGLLTGLIRVCKESSDFQVQLIASCMHLDGRYGYTLNEIVGEGFELSDTVPMLDADSGRSAMVKSIADGMSKFVDVYDRLSPDLVIILGDRYEALAAAQAASLMEVPVAHIHGGEVTEGALDDKIRHCITKLSSLHFVAAEEYRRRVIQMGEAPDSVFNVGSLGIENVRLVAKKSRAEVEEFLQFSLGDKCLLVTCHPETVGVQDQDYTSALFEALENKLDLQVIFTYPNGDPGGQEIARKIDLFCSEHRGRAKAFKSLGFKRYIQTAHHVSAVLGNSSSALIEVPSIGVPSINIGDRQKGRLRAPSVIDVNWSKDNIQKAMDLALTRDFRQLANKKENPYGVGKTSLEIFKILQCLKSVAIQKRGFFDLDVSYDA